LKALPISGNVTMLASKAALRSMLDDEDCLALMFSKISMVNMSPTTRAR
jgi:hypothetical protein